jgi:hypothetical protein
MNVSRGLVSRKRRLGMSKALTWSRYWELADHRVVKSPRTDVPSKSAQVSIQKALRPRFGLAKPFKTIWRTDVE